jgi:hypothetical protein
MFPWLLILVALALPADVGAVAPSNLHPQSPFDQSLFASSPHARASGMRCRHCKAHRCGTTAIGCCTSCLGPSGVMPDGICLATPTRHEADPTILEAVQDQHRRPDPYPPKPTSIV